MAQRLTRRQTGLLALGAILTALCFVIRSFSPPFAEETPGRPILEAVGLLAAATVVYLAALGLALTDGNSGRGTLPIILGYALLFRLVLLASTPILEIDFYRYLWDGRVALHGFNPYRYSPFQIEDVDSLDAPPGELIALSRLSQGSEAVREIFGRVHYRDVPTVYPPAAQAVFAIAVWLTPADAPLVAHILVLKGILVAFDLGTLGLLILLLRQLQLPTSWCLAWGWCPLVLKEVANSGHLDSIAVFFTVLAVFLFVTAAQKAGFPSPPLRRRGVGGEGVMSFAKGTPSPPPLSPEAGERGEMLPVRQRGVACLLALGGSISLALGVLSKTYPLLLLPVVGAFLLARFRRKAFLPIAAFVATVVAGYLPFCGGGAANTGVLDAPHHAASGLGTFLTQWEMNDCLFMVAYQNLRRPETGPAPCFVIVPGSWRTGLHDAFLDPLRQTVDLSPRINPAFLLSQLLLGSILLALCLHWSRQVYRDPEPLVLLRAVFRTLAWGWLLASAQNPWYLLWCLPFMVFDGRLAWFLLPGAALLYYVRFRIAEHSATAHSFDFGWVWLEYGPFFLLLAVESWWRSPGWRAATVGERFPAGGQPLMVATREGVA